MKRLISGLLLILSCSVVRAEYAAVDQIVYNVNDESGNAWVHNILNTSGTVTIPAYVTYRGVQYKVTGITKNDFNTNARNTYNFSSALIGSGLITGLVTLDAAVREREERPFRADYDYIRSTIKTLNLPNTLVFIDEKAFDGMKSLKSLIIPASVKYLPDDGILSSNSVFRGYLPNLQSITILGLPEFEAWDKGEKRTITLISQDEEGNLNYIERIKEKFDLSYCRNLVSFSMPEFEKRRPLIKAFYKANASLEGMVNSCNSKLKKGKIPVPAIKDEACSDAQTIQEALNQAIQYINTMFNCCKSQEQLYDSLTNLLQQHPYYDGSELTYEIPLLDPQEPQTSSIVTLSKKIKANLVAEYNELIEGKMERNLLINQTEKYVKIYTGLHPEKKADIENFFKNYMCETKATQNVYFVKYMDYGRVDAISCREKRWKEYHQYFESASEFNESYNRAQSDLDLRTEIGARKNAFEKVEDLKLYVPSHIKEIKLSNMNKKPNAATSEVIKCLNYTKAHYFYTKVVSYLIETIPSVKKEYEKNGQYFKSEVEFFEAYSLDSYNNILKENKKK